MRCICLLVVVSAGCGSDPKVTPDAPMQMPDAQQTCQPLGAIGEFYRRAGNPRLIAGTHTFSDTHLDTAIADPDLRWDEATSTWHLYYQSPHGDSFTTPGPMVIRHLTSPDLTTWTFDDTPSLGVSSDVGAWDHANTETPSIVYNPDAPADRRYLLYYSGASGAFPHPGYTFANYAIGVAISADGKTFTRITAAESPHGKDGLVLLGTDVYPGVTDAIVADPDVVYVAGVYHMWFSSFACTGGTCATSTGFGVGHATSTDGIHWTNAETPVRSLLRTSADPTTGGQQPSVIYDDIHCRWEIWQRSDLAGETDVQPVIFNNMAGVWHATSNNATSWTINYASTRDLEWRASAPDPGEHLGLLTGATVASKSTGRYMIYVGFDDQNVPANSYLPDHSGPGFGPGVMTLQLATRDAPP